MLWFRFTKTDEAFVDATSNVIACDKLIANLKRQRRNGLLAIFAVVAIILIACIVLAIVVHTRMQSFLHDFTMGKDVEFTILGPFDRIPGAIYAFLGANVMMGIYYAIALVRDLDHHIKILLMIRSRQ